MQDLRNPYIVGKPVTTEQMFFGREDVFDFVRHNLTGEHRDNVLMLYGQRRTGKTSVLEQMSRHIERRYVCVLVSFHMFFRDEFLPQVLDAIGPDRHLLIMLDETVRLQEQVEAGNLSPDIFGYLRHVMQHSERVNFLFSLGSSVEEMRKEYALLFSVGIYKKISFLDRASAIGLITKPVASMYRYEPAAIERILELTSCHPYFVQLLCHTLFNAWQRESAPSITAAHVDGVVAEAMELGSPVLKYVWEDSSPAEKAVMAAVALGFANHRHGVTGAEVVRLWGELEVSLPATELHRGLRNLVERDVLAGTDEFTFTVEVQRRWIEAHELFDGLGWVKTEIESMIVEWQKLAEADARVSLSKVLKELTPLDADDTLTVSAAPRGPRWLAPDFLTVRMSIPTIVVGLILVFGVWVGNYLYNKPVDSLVAAETATATAVVPTTQGISPTDAVVSAAVQAQLTETSVANQAQLARIQATTQARFADSSTSTAIALRSASATETPVPATLAPLARASVAPRVACASTALARAGALDRVLGVDVSQYQRAVDWAQVAAKGFYFAFIRATDGAGVTDESFARNWQAAGEAGLLRTAYHYLRADPDGAAQAKYYLDALQKAGVGPCDLPPMLDFEAGDADIAVAWLQVVRQRYGTRPIVASGRYFRPFSEATQLVGYPLFYINYAAGTCDPAKQPTPPPFRSRYDFWGFTDSGALMGPTGGSFDEDCFIGTADELFALTQ